MQSPKDECVGVHRELDKHGVRQGVLMYAIRCGVEQSVLIRSFVNGRTERGLFRDGGTEGKDCIHGRESEKKMTPSERLIVCLSGEQMLPY